ncbi:MAG: aldo/keto reductase [Propionibacteriaceae bacterium]|jgi:2,5-diketo-D-gluconate reductase A|nr:aldo/keto reductase [Propionibacteriaceae bacterium]
MTNLTMNDGLTIPALGYGTWRVTDEEACALVTQAFTAGYRHIDTARLYYNEDGVGQAIAQSGLDRSEIFITTKLWHNHHQDPEPALEASLKRLGLDWVDLYLIHWPVPALGLYPQAWEGLIKLRERGLTRSIGVSNFLVEHLEAIAPSGVVPAINQVELHPTFANREVADANAERGILTQCYRPLGNGDDLTNPTVREIASRLEATAAQVVIAWHLAKGYVAIPKSVTPARIKENLAAKDLSLTAADIAAIDALDCNNRQAFHPAEFAG